MNCNELMRHLNAYLDGELPALVRAEAKMHVAACRSCGIVVETCRSTIQVYRQQHPPLPDLLHRKVMDNVGRRLRPPAAQ